LVERFLLKCFHLVAFNLVTFNLEPFNLGAFNLDTSVAVRQLASYYARSRFANRQLHFVLAGCVTLYFIDDRCVTANS
jgi:hypothetical protein